MNSVRYTFVCFILAVFLSASALGFAATTSGSAKKGEEPEIAVTQDLGDAVKREAAKVKEQFEQQAKALFERQPLGWDLHTLNELYKQALSLPLKIPELTQRAVEQSRILGLFGSILVLLFVLFLIYSLLGQTRVLKWIERKARPLGERIPEGYYPYFLSFLRVVVSVLIPVVLLGIFWLINAMISYPAAWFKLTGSLLGLWAISALVLRSLKEVLTRGLFKVTEAYGKRIFRYARLVVLYIISGIALFWAAGAFKVHPEFFALLRFGVSVSVVTLLFLFFLKKSAFLSLFPDLPYRGYGWFLRFLRAYYYPLLIVSYVAALLWCIGYRALGQLLLTKIWFTLGALLAVSLIYYSIRDWLIKWSGKLDREDEAAQSLVRSLESLFLYTTILTTAMIMLNLLGLLYPLQRIMSFPLFQLGGSPVTIWIILKAVLIFLGFVLASRLLQAYLDYKVYPAIGVDPGLGYALNTFVKYLSLAVGFMIALELVGLDLRFLLVFAGAAGIGIGLGMQSLAANIISGFTIIFSGKIRKGDWIEVAGTLGTVTDIFLRATKVRTRDNIEYLIPNTDLISNTLVNYSLSSPLIRIELPVGVSYNADPREVERILVDVAAKEPQVSNYRKPVARFVEYGDSSINFELLIWIDVSAVPRRKVRSALYYQIFEEFKKAGIEIPFPQRDLHMRSVNESVDSTTLLPAAEQSRQESDEEEGEEE